MKYRKLRIAWSVAWGVVAVLLCVLWVRSYEKTDVFNGFSRNSIVSMRGGLFFGSERFGVDETRLSVESILKTQLAGHTITIWSVSDGVLIRSGIGTAVPIAVLVPLMAALAAIPWLTWCHRFRLRTLLIATTLVAVVLGLVVWLF